MKRKIILATFIFLLMLLLSVLSFASVVTVGVENVVIEGGEDSEIVELPISISNNSGLSGLQLNVYYSDKLSVEGITHGDALSNLDFLQSGSLDLNPIVLIWDSLNVEDDTNGIVAKIKFLVPRDINKNYLIRVEVVDAYDFNINTVEIETVNGVISVKEAKKVECIGVSLVLDGAIGMKIYFSVDETKISANSIFVQTSGFELVQNRLMYDATKNMHYAMIYISPKDSSKHFDFKASYNVGTNKKEITIQDLNVLSYIESFKELAKTDAELVKAEALVDSLESYIDYADSYFNNREALDNVTADLDAINAVEQSSKIGTLNGLEFYGTTLLLEDKTTIRHYFKVTDKTAQNTFVVNGVELAPQYKVDGDITYLYVDIADIAAQDLDEYYTLVVSDDCEVSYSALNYVKNKVNDSNGKLSNLVKALYNYYYEANEYVK